jgi:hypothetical protein
MHCFEKPLWKSAENQRIVGLQVVLHVSLVEHSPDKHQVLPMPGVTYPFPAAWIADGMPASDFRQPGWMKLKLNPASMCYGQPETH